MFTTVAAFTLILIKCVHSCLSGPTCGWHTQILYDDEKEGNLDGLPMVEICEGSNSPSVNLRSMHVFPTPESPSMSSLNNTSYCLAMTETYNTTESMTLPSNSLAPCSHSMSRRVLPSRAPWKRLHLNSPGPYNAQSKRKKIIVMVSCIIIIIIIQIFDYY